jgi:flagellar FliL protein
MADDTTGPKTKVAAGARAGTRGARSGKGKLLLVVVLLAGGAGGYVLKGGGTAEPVAGATATTAAPEPGTMIELAPLSLNLADDRYLRVGVAVQLVEGEGGEPEAWLADNGPVLRDLLIRQLGGVHAAELSTADGREVVRRALLDEASSLVDEQIYALYFTDFVMQ